jgi:hypothetical protein
MKLDGLKGSSTLYGVFVLAGLVLCAGGCWASSGTPASTARDGESTVPLGINLELVSDWSRSLMFADAMKSARHWGSPSAPWDEAAAMDEGGWPTRDAGVVIMAAIPSSDGTYKLSFVGRANVQPVASSGVRIAGLTYDAASNISRADVVIDKTASQLLLSFTGTQVGVKNVKLMRPGHSPEDTFTRRFLARLQPFQVLRFMDYSTTNLTTEVNWSDRTQPTAATQQRRLNGAIAGSAWEYAIELANLTGRDPWINVPDQASDQYVLNLATLFKGKLSPDRKLYVEWSNEVWNDLFAQTQRNYAATSAEVTAGGSNLNSDGETNPYYLAWRRIARRGKEVSDIFRSVFGDAAMMTRVRPVLASHVARPIVLTQGLEFIERVYGPPSKFFYAAAGTTYFNISNDTRTTLTVDQIFAELPAQLRVGRQQQTTFTAVCQYYKLKNVAYEGGPHLVGEASMEAKVAANRDPRMKDMMVENYKNWFSTGGDLNVHFNLASPWNKFGSWGLTDNIEQDTPKNAAIAEVLASPRPPVTIGSPVPARLASDEVMLSENIHKPGDGSVGFTGPASSVSFLVRVPVAKEYSVGAHLKSDAAAKAKLLIDSDLITTWTLRGSGEKLVPTKPAVVRLDAGLHVIRIGDAQGSFLLRSVSVESASVAE